MRRLSLLGIAPVVAVALSGCGFQPLYGRPATVSALSAIDVDVIESRTGFLLREQLEDQFGRNREVSPRYRLEAKVREQRSPIGARVNNVAGRYALNVAVSYQLFDIAARKAITGGDVYAQATYDSADPPYAGVAAQQNAEERAASEAAIQVRLQLARFFIGSPPK